MRLLLDTHILLWALTWPDRLPDRARALIEDADTVLFSAASIWEIAIKGKARPDVFRARADDVLEAALIQGFEERFISAAVTCCTTDLPLHHRDPFDRLLVAQAIEEPARLLTADRRLAAYSELVTVI
jgi:PIN domain nuclease of toxin-antitoxin system